MKDAYSSAEKRVDEPAVPRANPPPAGFWCLPYGAVRQKGDAATDFLSAKILLVEDNPSDVELTLRSLKESNFLLPIAVVGDGEEAMEFIHGTGRYSGREASALPLLVLLDLKLPKVDGAEVVKQLRADERTRNIPVVVLTSCCRERDFLESHHLGADSYIVKPVDSEQFTKTVRQLGLYRRLLDKTPGGRG